MPKQILLVDDSVTIHRVVEITFAQEDFALTTVKSADEGIDKAKSLKPDLVLVDSTLGGKSGYDVIAAIRADGALAHTACLLLTGNFSPYDEAKGGSVGSDGFVVKPFDTQAMIDKAKDAIQRRVSGGTTAQPVAAMPKPAPTVTPAAAATTLSPPPNLAATPRGVETLGKPLSSVAAEASQRVASQPSIPTLTSQPAMPIVPPPAAAPRPVAPPAAATLTPPPSARAQPKATLMGIPAVNPASIGMTPPPVTAMPSAPTLITQAPTAPAPAAHAPAPAAHAPAAAAHAPAPAGHGPTATVSAAPTAVVAKPNVLSPPPKAAPVAAPPAAAHAMPQNVPTMPRPSLVPGVATPTARAAEAPKPIVPEKTPQREVAPQRDVSPAVREVAQKTVDAIPAAMAAKGPEYEAIAKLSREVIEQVVWEIVPELAESIIRAELDRLVRERQNA